MTQINLTKLSRSQLHASLGDPSLQAVVFLNEIMGRYPHAISFAPGAPFPGFFTDLDIRAYLDRYAKYLSDEEGLTGDQVRRRLFEYGASNGQIRELVVTYLHKDFDIVVPPQAVVITVGSQEAMFLVLRAVQATSNDILAIVTPCYVGIVGAARLLDCEIVSIEEDARGIDLAKLRMECKSARNHGKRVRLLYVAPDFANPSGAQMNLKTRIELLALANEEDFLILEDSTYSFTVPEGLVLPSLKSIDASCRVIYLGTFSKVCLPGTRVGFVVADQLVHGDVAGKRCLADELALLKTMVTVNTSPICQAVIGGMLLANGGSLKEIAHRKTKFYQDNLQYLIVCLKKYLSSLDQVQWNVPNGGFFVRLRLPIFVDLALAELSAQQFGVVWTPMANFYLGNVESQEIRLSCSYLTFEQIDQGVFRLAAFLKYICSRGFDASPSEASNESY